MREEEKPKRVVSGHKDHTPDGQGGVSAKACVEVREKCAENFPSGSCIADNVYLCF